MTGLVARASECDWTFNDAEALIERAETVLAGMGGSFALEAADQVGRLDAAFEALSSAGHGAAHDPSLRPYFDEAFDASQELMGQAGTFGYSLLAHVCESLCLVIERRDRLPHGAVDAIGQHIVAVHVILDRRLKGEGGSVGATLVRELAVLHRFIALACD